MPSYRVGFKTPCFSPFSYVTIKNFFAFDVLKGLACVGQECHSDTSRITGAHGVDLSALYIQNKESRHLKIGYITVCIPFKLP